MADSCKNSTSVLNLHKIIQETKPSPRPLPLQDRLMNASSFGHRHISATDVQQERFLLGLDVDEVYPGVFVGDEGAAKNKDYLTNLGITHVLNVAEGLHVGQVDTNAAYYNDTKMKYLGLPLMDYPETQIANFFEEGAAFIDGALSNHGKVLVHCVMGLSRSATMVIAYLMLRKGMSAEGALKAVRQQRDVRPNDGFLQQLCELNRKLNQSSQRQSSLCTFC